VQQGRSLHTGNVMARVELTWVLVVVSVLASSCTPTERAADSADRAHIVPADWRGMGAGSIRYELGWLTEGIDPSDSGDSWSVTTDSGVWVRVDSGYLVSYSMELLECEDSAAGGIAWDWLGFLAFSDAHAGHDTSVINLVAIAEPFVESLTDFGPSVFGTTVAEGAVYCDAFYLVAKALRESRQLPEETQMVGRSLFVTGVFREPNSQEEVEFVVDTAGADGLLSGLALSPPPSNVSSTTRYESKSEAALVRVERNLSSLFNGLDWNLLGQEEFSRAVVRNLIDDAVVSIVTRDAMTLGEL
jgi:hypothetical protein